MRCVAFLFGAILVALLMAPAAAEPAKPEDLAAIKSCLAKTDAAPAAQDACIESVAKPCFKNDETSATDALVTQCLEREQLVWDSLLNDAYKQLHDGLDADQQVKLRDMQRAWLDSRKRSCGFFYDFFQGTMANPMIASCENKETARRAIFLRLFVDDLPKQK